MLLWFFMVFLLGGIFGIVFYLSIIKLTKDIKYVRNEMDNFNIYGKVLTILYFCVVIFIGLLVAWLISNEKDSLSNIIIASSTLGLFLLALITLVYSVIKDSDGRFKKEK